LSLAVVVAAAGPGPENPGMDRMGKFRIPSAVALLARLVHPIRQPLPLLVTAVLIAI